MNDVDPMLHKLVTGAQQHVKAEGATSEHHRKFMEAARWLDEIHDEQERRKTKPAKAEALPHAETLPQAPAPGKPKKRVRVVRDAEGAITHFEAD